MLKIIFIIIVLVLLGFGFYFFVPIKENPLSGGPVDRNHPIRKLKKVPLAEYYRLRKGILERTIVE